MYMRVLIIHIQLEPEDTHVHSLLFMYSKTSAVDSVVADSLIYSRPAHCEITMKLTESVTINC